MVTVGANNYVACDFHSTLAISDATSGIISTPGPQVDNTDPSVDESVAC